MADRSSGISVPKRVLVVLVVVLLVLVVPLVVVVVASHLLYEVLTTHIRVL